VIVVFSSDNEDGPYDYDLYVRSVLGAITNDYPTPSTTSNQTTTGTETGTPLDMTYVVVGASLVGVVAVVVILIRMKR